MPIFMNSANSDRLRQSSSLSLPSPNKETKALINMVKEVMVHLYSFRPEYQERALSNFYAQNAQFTDALLTVKGRKNIARVFNFYFGMVARSVRTDVRHVSCSPAPIAYGHQKSTTTLKNGVTIMVDHQIVVEEFTTIGKLLYFLRLLPPCTYLSYANNESSNIGLRVISKIDYVPDESAQSVNGALSIEENGFIVSHEDIYSASGIVSLVYLYPVFWILFYLNVLAYGLSVGLQWMNVFLSFVSLNLMKNITSSIPVVDVFAVENGQEVVKRSIGWLLSQVILPITDRKSSQLNGHIERK
ncbi:hypothetical protein MIR68_005570 [Amoeboaphelidium protococcarum]|nr:hypothetical protein MIR68_005570 [Amoeboaphelidium protococcarum]